MDEKLRMSEHQDDFDLEEWNTKVTAARTEAEGHEPPGTCTNCGAPMQELSRTWNEAGYRAHLHCTVCRLAVVYYSSTTAFVCGLD